MRSKVGTLKDGIFNLKSTLLEISHNKVLVVEDEEYYTEDNDDYSIMSDEEVLSWYYKFSESLEDDDSCTEGFRYDLEEVFPKSNSIDASKLLNNNEIQLCVDMLLSNGAGIGLVLDSKRKVFQFVI